MGPLEGIRVVEMAGLGAGPLCGMMLADLGASVLVIERPGHQSAEASAHVHEVDPLLRGKMRQPLDLKSPTHVELLREIIGRSQVLLESYRPGVMERLGLGPSVICNNHPSLVYARMTGWGQTGPWAHRAGHDPNYIGATGALFHSGRSAEAPMAPPTLLGDAAGGAALMTSGITSALIPAIRDGRGQVIDGAIAEGTNYLATYAQSFYQAGQLTDQRCSGWLDGGAPWNDTYRTHDEAYMVVAAIEPQFYACLLAQLKLADHPLFSDLDQWERSRWGEQRAVIAELFESHSRAFWETVFDDGDACVSSMLTYGEARTHPQFQARHAFFEQSGQWFPAPAPRFSDTSWEPADSVEGAAARDYLRVLGVPEAALKALQDYRVSGES